MWFLLAAFLNDSLKALVAAALLRRVLPERGIRFDCLHDFWIYLAAAVVAAPALSGVAGAASWVALGREFWPTWRNWFLGDALANIVLTPLLLCLATDWRKLTAASPLRYLEGLAVFSGLVLAVQLAYQRGLNNPRMLDLYDYIPVAFLLLAAIRFGPAGASGSLTIMSVLSVIATSTMPAELVHTRCDGRCTLHATVPDRDRHTDHVALCADGAATKDGTIPARKRSAFPEYGRYRARDDLDFRPG